MVRVSNETLISLPLFRFFFFCFCLVLCGFSFSLLSFYIFIFITLKMNRHNRKTKVFWGICMMILLLMKIMDWALSFHKFQINPLIFKNYKLAPKFLKIINWPLIFSYADVHQLYYAIFSLFIISIFIWSFLYLFPFLNNLFWIVILKI